MAVNAPVDCEPVVASSPVQPPDAAQEVALVEFQVSVALPPLRMELGLALRLAVGTGATVTMVVALAEPPAPVHVRV